VGNYCYISPALELAAIQAEVGDVDTVVDAIRAVDVPAIVEGMPTDEDIALKGGPSNIAINDYFSNVVYDGDPDATFWTTFKGAGALVKSANLGNISGLKLYSSAPSEEASIYSKDKRHFLWGTGKTLVFRTRMMVSDLTAKGGVGFYNYREDVEDIANIGVAAKCGGYFFFDNDTVQAYTATGANEQTTDLSAFISNNVFFELRVEAITGSVKFYIDNLLRATHETQVPNDSQQAFAIVSEENGTNDPYLMLSFIKAYPK